MVKGPMTSHQVCCDQPLQAILIVNRPLMTSQVGVSTQMCRWIDQSSSLPSGPEQTLLIYPSHIQVDTPTCDVIRGRFSMHPVARHGTFKQSQPSDQLDQLVSTSYLLAEAWSPATGTEKTWNRTRPDRNQAYHHHHHHHHHHHSRRTFVDHVPKWLQIYIYILDFVHISQVKGDCFVDTQK